MSFTKRIGIFGTNACLLLVSQSIWIVGSREREKKRITAAESHYQNRIKMTSSHLHTVTMFTANQTHIQKRHRSRGERKKKNRIIYNDSDRRVAPVLMCVCVSSSSVCAELFLLLVATLFFFRVQSICLMLYLFIEKNLLTSSHVVSTLRSMTCASSKYLYEKHVIFI